MIRKIKKSQTKDHKSLNFFEKEQENYQRLTNTLTTGYLRSSDHNLIISEINQQLKRPETTYAMKKDYRGLKKLASCGLKLQKSKQKSIQCFKVISGIINDRQKRKFRQFSREIRASEIRVDKNRSHKKDWFGSKYEKTNDSFLETNEDKLSQIEIYEMTFAGFNQIEIQEKLQLLGELTEEEKNSYLDQVKKIIIQQDKQNNYSSFDTKKYAINHFILEKFLSKISHRTELLYLKEKYKKIYQKIKKQMVQVLINEEQFSIVLDNLIKYQERNKKKANRGIKRKKSNLFYQNAKEKDWKKSFQEIYIYAEDKVNNAFQKFHQNQPRPKTSNPKTHQKRWLGH